MKNKTKNLTLLVSGAILSTALFSSAAFFLNKADKKIYENIGRVCHLTGLASLYIPAISFHNLMNNYPRKKD